MYIGIIGLAWMYVVVLMAASEDSIAGGIGTFVFYGVLPLGILLYLLATPIRRKQRELKAAQADTTLVKHPPSSSEAKADTEGSDDRA